MLRTTTVQVNAAKLKEAMEAAGTSSRKLAAQAECAPSRIAQLAAGSDPGVGVATAAKISAALEREVAELFSFPDGEALIRLGLIRGI